MKGIHLGEFEELVILSVAILDDNAYSISIYDELEKQTGRKLILSSVHKTLLRLEDKGYLVSKMGNPSSERGGRAKRLYRLTSAGFKAISIKREVRNNMWLQIPNINLLGYE
ncbi:MAG: helix-turn-helix transcriptional regulator [Bacteroidota bacterium]